VAILGTIGQLTLTGGKDSCGLIRGIVADKRILVAATENDLESIDEKSHQRKKKLRMFRKESRVGETISSLEKE
jgi:hypothetical protein